MRWPRGDKPTQANYMECRGGGGATCCVFLTEGMSGFRCARADLGMRELLKTRAIMGLTQAKRVPMAAFPECKSQGLR